MGSVKIPEFLTTRQKSRYNSILDLCEGVSKFCDIIKENQVTDSSLLTYVGVDSSLNGTGLAFSIPWEIDDNHESETLLSLKLRICNLVFSHRLTTDEDSEKFFKMFSQYLEDDEELEISYFYFFQDAALAGKMIHHNLKNCVLAYDNFNGRLILSFSINHNSIIGSSEPMKLLSISMFINLIFSSLVRLIEYMMVVSTIFINEERLPWYSDNVCEKIVIKCHKALAIMREHGNNSYTRQLLSSNKERPILPIIAMEEINSSRDFAGLRATSMSYAATKMAIARQLIRISRVSLLKHNGIIISCPKSSMASFAKKSISDIADSYKDQVAGLRFKKDKIDQAAFVRTITGVDAPNDDIADSICLAYYAKNYYEFLQRMIKVLMFLDIISIEDGELIFTPDLYHLVPDEAEFKAKIEKAYKIIGTLVKKHFFNLNTIKNSVTVNAVKHNLSYDLL